MRRIIAFICFALFVSSFFTSCDFLFNFTQGGEPSTEPAVPSVDDDSNTLLGFPSDSVPGKSQIIEREAYTLLYDCGELLPVWVSWHLDAEDFGETERDDDFQPDPELPDLYQVEYEDYTNSGFDRGHLCPNADRDITSEFAKETFYMSNIAPQNPSLNQQDWKYLEEKCREYVDKGSELFIIAGVYGKGGTNRSGDNLLVYKNPGERDSTEISIPAHFWKVIVILDDGDGDLSRINENTIAFAVDFENKPVPEDLGWEDYTISIDTLESRTGLDFLSALPDDIEESLESRMQSGL